MLEDNHVDDEAAVNLSEALKSNTSLISLNLEPKNIFDSFHSHSIQIIILVMKD
jgi:hypothetical protein